MRLPAPFRPSLAVSVVLHAALVVYAFSGRAGAGESRPPSQVEAVLLEGGLAFPEEPTAEPASDPVDPPFDLPTVDLPPVEAPVPTPSEPSPERASADAGFDGPPALPSAVGLAHAPKALAVGATSSSPSTIGLGAGSEPAGSGTGREGASRGVVVAARRLPIGAAPDYPAFARERGWEGTVWVGATVEVWGEVSEPTVERSSGYALLDDSALTAVRSWRYTPSTVDGVPVRGRIRQPVEFHLR